MVSRTPPAHCVPFDLVALDLDGTILDKRFQGLISSRVRRAVAAVQAGGIPVTLATGRTLDYVRPLAQELDIRVPVITTQGAVVGDPRTGQIHFEATMPMEAARTIVRWAQAHDRVLVLYFSDGRGGTRMYQNREEWPPEVYDHWFGTPRILQPDLMELLTGPGAHPPLKFILVNDIHQEPDLGPFIQELLGPEVHVVRTLDLLVEGTARGVDKGAGLRHLCELLGLDPARVLAIGDNENDIPLLQAAGFGVAMGQASAKVKAVADWVAPPIQEDGAAVALERFVLEPLQRCTASSSSSDTDAGEGEED